MYDVQKVRADFPILSRQVNGKPLVYLDNGASAQKPQAVIDAVTRAYAQNMQTFTGVCISCRTWRRRSTSPSGVSCSGS